MANQWIGMSDDGETVTLKRFGGEFRRAAYASEQWIQENSEKIAVGAAIDVETTGVNKDIDSVIEIGVRRFAFNRETGELLKAEESYSGLQDPGKPLSDEITRLTGLTDEVLKGKAIDWEKVGEILATAEIIIAHNAIFDRPFVDRELKRVSGMDTSRKLWGCSFRQIEWEAKSHFTRKLEVLCIYHGFFARAHRALSDVDALVHLLSFPDASTGKTYLHELFIGAQRPFVRVVAASSPFETKDLLRARGYRWDAANRVWQKLVYKDESPAEVAWLERAVYNGRFRGIMEDIPVYENFR